MPDAHDLAALMRHAEQAGDWRLVELISHLLSGRASPPSEAAHRAYATLVGKLGLAGDAGDYHHA
jgi:hypothetical protein